MRRCTSRTPIADTESHRSCAVPDGSGGADASFLRSPLPLPPPHPERDAASAPESRLHIFLHWPGWWRPVPFTGGTASLLFLPQLTRLTGIVDLLTGNIVALHPGLYLRDE